MRRTLEAFSPLTSVMVILACAGSDTSSAGAENGASGTTVRDSAGVTIVESAGPTWTDPWVVEDSALFRIGDEVGVAAYELDGVAGAFRLSDGRLVVANRGTYELRWYSETGEHLFSAGRQGEGPGEFRYVTNLFWLPGDSVAAWDIRQSRVSVFDPDGVFVRTVRIDPTRFEDPGLGLGPITRLSGGDFLFVSGAGGSGLVVMMAPAQADYTDRQPMKVYQAGDGTSPIAPIVTVPGRDVVGVQIAGMGPSAMLYEFQAIVPRFALAAAHGDRWAIGANDRYELLLGGGDGTLERIVRASIEPLPVTSVVRDSAMSTWEGTALGELDPRADQALADLAEDHMDGLASLPFFSKLLLDPEGSVWVRDYGVTGSDADTWTVFDPEGVWLGTVTMPGDLDILSIGSNHVVGRSRDELGVESVAVHELTKP